MLNDFIKSPQGQEVIKELAHEKGIDLDVFNQLHTLKQSYQTVAGGRINKMMEIIRKTATKRQGE